MITLEEGTDVGLYKNKAATVVIRRIATDGAVMIIVSNHQYKSPAVIGIITGKLLS
jgi:hypothetical protein